MKYKNYEQLFAAYKSGELTAPMVLDNDYICVYIFDHPDDCEGTQLFEGNGPKQDIDLILDALGIPNEWC